MSERVDVEALGRRLQVLWRAPEVLREEAHWLRRAWLRVRGAGRELEMRAAMLRRFAEAEPEMERWRAQRGAVYEELEKNLETLERAAAADGSVPAARVDWLLAVHQWARSMDHAMTGPSRLARAALGRGLAGRARLGPAAEGGRQAGSVLALAGIDALLDEAAAETDRVGRRRRLLEAARRLLLEAEANAAKREPFVDRRSMVAAELEQLSALASSLREDLSLREQLGRARRRGDTRQALVACAAMTYLRAGTGRPISREAAALVESLPIDGRGSLPATVTQTVNGAFERARTNTEAALRDAGPSEAIALRRRRGELSDSARRALLRMALGVDGLFDVGGGIERDQVRAPVAVPEKVAYPTPALELEHSGSPDDVSDAIIDDPRLLIHELATRRLLVRRFRRQRARERERPRVRAAVRFYLLDGSSSMLGDRARMRDAILMAELASLISRLERPSGRIHSLLYYRYFNAAVEPTRRVATVDQALAAIEATLGTARTGGTDIQEALRDTLELIDEARRADVELTRAQVVLVTDGLARLEPEAIRELQERLDVPIRISVIVLGDDSAELRELARLQSNAGLRVLHHHVPDEELAALAAEAEGGWPSDAAVARSEAPHRTLEELEGLDGLTADFSAEMDEALEELGLSAADLGESARARQEAARRDRLALRRRFDRLFPELPVRMPTVPDPDEVEKVAILDALGVIVEVLALGSPEPMEAMVDAIALLERLLRTRGMTSPEYLATARDHPDELGPAIAAVRLSCGLHERS